jgi:hypothetical protein
VQVDESGRDDLARDVADVGRGGAFVLPDARDLAGRERDVGDRIDILGRVDDATVPQDQIVGDGSLA